MERQSPGLLCVEWCDANGAVALIFSLVSDAKASAADRILFRPLSLIG
jgi:hypothetical protein